MSERETYSAPILDQVRCRILPDGRMTRRDAAAYLGLAEKTLAMWELAKKGPRSIKVGGRRFYFKDELDAYIGGGKHAQSGEEARQESIEQNGAASDSNHGHS